jgi:hypothetical protein
VKPLSDGSRGAAPGAAERLAHAARAAGNDEAAVDAVRAMLEEMLT